MTEKTQQGPFPATPQMPKPAASTMPLTQGAGEEGKDRKRDIYRYQPDKKHNDKHDEEE